MLPGVWLCLSVRERHAKVQNFVHAASAFAEDQIKKQSIAYAASAFAEDQIKKQSIAYAASAFGILLRHFVAGISLSVCMVNATDALRSTCSLSFGDPRRGRCYGKTCISTCFSFSGDPRRGRRCSNGLRFHMFLVFQDPQHINRCDNGMNKKSSLPAASRRLK
jgi:hypothetical protein